MDDLTRQKMHRVATGRQGTDSDSGLSLRDRRAKAKFERVLTRQGAHLDELLPEKIEEGDQWRIITTRPFNAIALLDRISRLDPIRELWMVAYRMNKAAVQFLQETVDSGVQVHLLTSSFFRENKKYEGWCQYLVEQAQERENLAVGFAHSHAKVAAMKTVSDEYVVMEGSGNFSDNPRIEQYLIEGSRQMYEFHRDWIREVLNEQ